MKLKILHINNNDLGGAGIAVVRLHNALLEKDIDSNILFLNEFVSGKPNSYKFLAPKAHWLFRLLHRFKLMSYKHEINTESLRGKVGKYEMFSFPATDYNIARHHLVKEADIIHLHWVANFLDWGSFFKVIKKPIVWTLHDMNPFLGGFHYLNDKNRNNDIFQELESKYISIKINAIKNFDNLHIVCPSNWICSQSRHSKILGNYPHYVLPNSVMVDTFKPLDIFKSRVLFNLPNDKKIILFVAASLTIPRKGFSLLMNAIERLDNEEYALAIVGDISSLDFKESKNIFYLGKINDESILAAAYSAANLFVIPSIEDNLPNTMLESLACGTPVVGFNIGGIPDAILSGFNGFIVDKIDSDDLYRVIVNAINYNFDRYKIAEDAVNRFGPNSQASSFIDLYNSVLKA